MQSSTTADRLLRMLVAAYRDLDQPALRGIDASRAEPLTLLVKLARGGWKVGGATRKKAA